VMLRPAAGSTLLDFRNQKRGDFRAPFAGLFDGLGGKATGPHEGREDLFIGDRHGAFQLRMTASGGLASVYTMLRRPVNRAALAGTKPRFRLPSGG